MNIQEQFLLHRAAMKKRPMKFYRTNQVTINYNQCLVNKQLTKPINLRLTLRIQ